MDKGPGVRQYAPVSCERAGRCINNAQLNRRPVPSFASFRPTPQPSDPENTANATRQDHVAAEHSDVQISALALASSSGVKERSHERKRKHRHRSQIPQRERDKELKSQLLQGHSPDTHSEKSPLDTNLFVIDKIGDPKNLQFGSLDRYSLPLYSRRGGGEVVGSAKGQRIDHHVSSEKGLVLSSGDSLRSSKYTLRSRSVQWPHKQRLIKKDEGGNIAHSTQDYISLKVPKYGRHGTTGNGDPASLGKGLMADTNIFELNIVRTKSESGSSQDELSSEDDDSPKASGNTASFLRKSGELNKLIESDPKNGNIWLELVQHQDVSLGSKPSAAERESIADIKISLMEKALSRVEDSHMREKLVLQKMREARKIWSSRSLLSEWNALLRENPQSSLLWVAYLDFRLGDFPSFKCEEFQSVCRECLDILCQSSLKTPHASKKAQIYNIQLFVLLRTTACMRESGFCEHAIAIWQANLEHEYFTPLPLKHMEPTANAPSDQGKISAFEDFWESEVPRFGEEGAEGWLSYSLQAKGPPEARKEILDRHDEDCDAFSAWISAETANSKSKSRHLPARTLDETPENDPFRVILFSDIKPYLIEAPHPNSHIFLLNAFLSFCGLPKRLGESVPELEMTQSMSFQHLASVEDAVVGTLGSITTNSQDGQCGMSPKEIEGNNYDIPNPKQFQVDTTNLFDRLGSWSAAFDASQILESRDWILRALKSIAQVTDRDDEIAEYVVAFEASRSLELAKKTVRKFLKTQTSSMRLYNAYALIEFRLGNSIKGEHAIISALDMSRNLSANARKDQILLWHTWMWELVSGGETAKAASRISQFGKTVHGLDVSTLDSTTIMTEPDAFLHSERALQALLDEMLSQKMYRHACHAADCLMLSAYLRDGVSVHAAHAVLETNLGVLAQSIPFSGPYRELLHQSGARLLYAHATRSHHFKPSQIREILAHSIAEFPHNTILLHVYEWNETRFRVHDRLRAILEDVVLRPDSSVAAAADMGVPESSANNSSIASHFFAIRSELHRGEGRGSNVHTVRAAFERAVQSDSGAHCPAFWHAYFHYERSRGDIKKATALFYRSIRACPWAKQLYLLPFQYLRAGRGERDGMADADLKAVYDLMLTKELRIHEDLEEMIEEREGAMRQ